jgi:hypothetical protein
VAVGVFVANPPIGHFQSLLLGNATIAPFNNPAKSIDDGKNLALGHTDARLTNAPAVRKVGVGGKLFVGCCHGNDGALPLDGYDGA